MCSICMICDSRLDFMVFNATFNNIFQLYRGGYMIVLQCIQLSFI